MYSSGAIDNKEEYSGLHALEYSDRIPTSLLGNIDTNQQKEEAKLRKMKKVLDAFHYKQVHFENTILGLLDYEQFVTGCESIDTFNSVDYTTVFEKSTDEIIVNISFDTQPESMIMNRGRVALQGMLDPEDQRPLYSSKSQEERIRRLSATRLFARGLGHTQKDGNGLRHHAHTDELRAHGIDYISFSDGFNSLVMTAIDPQIELQRMEQTTTSVSTISSQRVA